MSLREQILCCVIAVLVGVCIALQIKNTEQKADGTFVTFEEKDKTVTMVQHRLGDYRVRCTIYRQGLKITHSTCEDVRRM